MRGRGHGVGCPHRDGHGDGCGQRAAERGSQSVEVALVMPAVALLLVLLVHAALLGVDLVAAQGVAREAARVAAVADDATVREAAARVAGGRQVRLDLDPAQRQPGDLVTASVRLQTRAFVPFSRPLWLPGAATMRVEDAPGQDGDR